MHKIYDYRKLKGRIKEYFGTQSNFASSINCSEVALNNKLNNKSVWNQDEIAISIERLNITTLEELKEIFFTEKV